MRALTIQVVDPAPSDAELVAAIAEGDRLALTSLYSRYAALVLGIGRRILRTQSDAEDLTHDVFIEVWRHAHEYQPSRGSVRTWVLMRARSRAIDRVKSAAYSRVVPLENAPETTVAHKQEGVGFDSTVVLSALGSLSEDQRTILELGYFEGLSLSEIADRINVPVGTIKSRLSRALSRLRELVVENQ